MDIQKWQQDLDANRFEYNMRDKLAQHVFRRSEAAFRRADAARDAIKDKTAFEAYTKQKREAFIEALGGIPYDKSLPLCAETTGVIEEEHLIIEKVIFQARPAVYVTATLYIPKKRKEKCGAVLFQCGHMAEGKASALYQRVARHIATSGLIVLCMDPRGQGERLSYLEEGFAEPMVPDRTLDHSMAGGQCVLSGDSLARYFIADAMRAVDYLETRPEVDPNKIGATGNSGGGTATCHMMVCDERIVAAAPGTFVTSREAYLYGGGAQDAEQIWMGATANGFDHHECLLCFAPKPVLLLAVDSDFFHIEGTAEVFRQSKRFWGMYDKEDDLKMCVDKSIHRYTETLAAVAGEFFAAVLNGEARTSIPDAIFDLPVHELHATKSGQVKRDYPDAKFAYEENIERLAAYKKLHNAAEGKAYLAKCVHEKREPVELHVHRPWNGEIFEYGFGITPLMWFSQKQLPTFAISFRDYQTKDERLPIVICLFDKGTDDLETRMQTIRGFCAQKKRVVILDLAGIGKNEPEPLLKAYTDAKSLYAALHRLADDLFFLDDSLCALRLFELEYAFGALEAEFGTDDISIYAEGKSAILAKLYGVLHASTPITVANAESLTEMAHTKYYNRYNCEGFLLPGILKYMDI